MRLKCVLVIALVVLTLAGPALAQTPANPIISSGGDSIIGRAEQRREETGSSRRSPEGRNTAPSVSAVPTPPLVYRSEIRWVAETQSTCVSITQQEGDPNDVLNVYQEMAAFDWARSPTPRCGASVAAPVTLSPAAAAQIVWRDQMKLPPPEPYIAPGKAITGLRAFLEIRGPRTRTQTFNVFGYDLTVTATATSYDVDWGDGAWSRGLTSSGGPWPNGDVRHVFTTQGTYTVRVIERWTGTWSLAGGGGGSVDGTLSSEGRIDAFPVVQVQAVRNR